jgi:hypothetical protein
MGNRCPVAHQVSTVGIPRSTEIASPERCIDDHVERPSPPSQQTNKTPSEHEPDRSGSHRVGGRGHGGPADGSGGPDARGSSASGSFTVHVKGAAEQLTDLATQVQGVGPGRSLAAKIAAAQQSLARGDTAATCGQLTAFLNEVAAQRGKRLPAVIADQLIADTQRIQAVIGC